MKVQSPCLSEPNDFKGAPQLFWEYLFFVQICKFGQYLIAYPRTEHKCNGDRIVSPDYVKTCKIYPTEM